MNIGDKVIINSSCVIDCVVGKTGVIMREHISDSQASFLGRTVNHWAVKFDKPFVFEKKENVSEYMFKESNLDILE